MVDVPDFFDSSYGHYEAHMWRGRRASIIKDMLFDARLWLNPSYRALAAEAEHHAVRNILIMGVEVPARADDLKKVMQELSRTRHRVTTKISPLREGFGKFQNINASLAGVNIADYDWLIVVDDDIAFSEHFLDRFIFLAESADLQLCQPAHKFCSYQSYELTLRQLNSLARLTHFVECGPLTAFRKPIFQHVLPFPELRWAWGTDIAWSETARNAHLPIGIIDATPIRHLRPVGVSYDVQLAMDEAKAFLQRLGITREKSDILQTTRVIYEL